MPTLISIDLTPEQLEKLYDILLSAQDEGPDNEGWASPELLELREIISDAGSVLP